MAGNVVETAVESLKARIDALSNKRSVSGECKAAIEDAASLFTRKDENGNVLPPDMHAVRRCVMRANGLVIELADFYNNEPRYLIQVHNRLNSTPLEDRQQVEIDHKERANENRKKEEEIVQQGNQTEGGEDDPEAIEASKRQARRSRSGSKKNRTRSRSRRSD